VSNLELDLVGFAFYFSFDSCFDICDLWSWCFDKKYWCWSWRSWGWIMLWLGLILNQSSLMLKCWILIVLSLIWSSSNLLVFMIMFLVNWN